ncbi:MAG: prepilin-type N-terminal cleavage/methylation domain-containing protein [Candidatus Taylorbacteria bacterium]
MYKKGFSLLELVLSISIFAIGSIAAGNLLIDANTATRIDLDKTEAVQIAREGIEAVTSIRDSGFENLIISGPHGLTSGGGGYGWVFSASTSDTVDTRFSRSITITLNPASSFTSTSTATVVSTVSWTNARSVTDFVSLTTILTNWRLPGV